MDLSKINKIYMIGIKGVGMTMLGQFLKEKGKDVSGSDIAERFMTDEVLKKTGIEVLENFNIQNIPNSADLIIYSTAYNSENNEEVKAALAGRIKTLTYAEALGEVFNQHHGIAVVGSHGKTTTTAWLGFVLRETGLEPNVMVGANVPQFGGNSITGRSNYLVIEADEYQNKLKHYNPRAVLLNNIDYDHPDFFPDEESYADAFIEFIKKIPKKGFLVANFDDPIIKKTAGVNCLCRVISYGIENKSAEYNAYDIKINDNKQYFKVKTEDGDELGDFSISLSGKHNIYNALAVIAAAIELEADLTAIRSSLPEFTGTARRMQILGQFRGSDVIDDYAHHPTEVKSTISGIRDLYPNKKIVVAFHPHTFTRTKALLENFATSFDGADKIIIIDIYGSAREKQGGVHSKDLVEKIAARGKDAIHLATQDDLEDYLRKNTQDDEVIVLMGAGDIFRVGERLVE